MEDFEDQIEEGNFGMPEVLKNFLAKELKLNILHTIADGIMAAKTLAGTEELNVRLVESEFVSKQEITEWPRLKHVNVLKLLSVQYLPVLDAFAFITVNHPFSLLSVLKNEEFFKSDKVVFIQRWLREILFGLEYLHEKEKCHLALCLENVLISSEFSAVIKAPSDKYNVPASYRAPEAKKFAEKQPLDGISFDLWCFGILSLRVFTRNDSENTVKVLEEPTCWWSDIYMGLYNSLQKKTFQELVKLSFPNSKVNRDAVTCMRNFVTSCLRLHPDERLPARHLIHHKYLTETGCLATSDDLWESRVSVSHLKEGRVKQAKTWLQNKCKGTASKFKSCFS